MTKPTLLPPNRTALERHTEQVAARIEDANAPFHTLWNAWECPLHLLPWLGWGLGVRQWSNDWSEQRKRQTVDSALKVRRYAGTAGAVREALKASQADNMRMEEWFDYGGKPGHFRLKADLTGVGLKEQEYHQIVAFVLNAKRLSAKWEGIYLTSITRGNISVGTTTQAGSLATVRPYQPEHLTTHGMANVATATQTGTSTTVRPYQPARLSERGLLVLGLTTQGSSYATLFPG